MNSISIETLQAYLYTRYDKPEWTQSLFMKLVEEIGEVAEAINKTEGRKHDDGMSSLAEELADVIHYAVAIATINGIDLSSVILAKDERASVKYNQCPNLTEFIKQSL